jgi:hypothetical protein
MALDLTLAGAGKYLVVTQAISSQKFEFDFSDQS